MALEREYEKTTPGHGVVVAKHAYTFDSSVFVDQLDKLAGRHGQEVVIDAILSRPRGAVLS